MDLPIHRINDFVMGHLTITVSGEDCKVRVWDLASGRMLAELKGHTLQVTGLDWSMDSSFLASASLDGTVRVWNSTLHIKSSTRFVIVFFSS